MKDNKVTFENNDYGISNDPTKKHFFKIVVKGLIDMGVLT